MQNRHLKRISNRGDNKDAKIYEKGNGEKHIGDALLATILTQGQLPAIDRWISKKLCHRHKDYIINTKILTSSQCTHHKLFVMLTKLRNKEHMAFFAVPVRSWLVGNYLGTH